MGDPPKTPAGPKPQQAWVAAFAMRLCLIAWTTAVLTEFLPPCGIESLCILIGSQAAALGILTCLAVGLRFRQGVFLILFFATMAPGVYFVIVLRQVAKLQGWFL